MQWSTTAPFWWAFSRPISLPALLKKHEIGWIGPKTDIGMVKLLMQPGMSCQVSQSCWTGRRSLLCRYSSGFGHAIPVLVQKREGEREILAPDQSVPGRCGLPINNFLLSTFKTWGKGLTDWVVYKKRGKSLIKTSSTVRGNKAFYGRGFSKGRECRCQQPVKRYRQGACSPLWHPTSCSFSHLMLFVLHSKDHPEEFGDPFNLTEL